ncbi:MAG: 16S rRNA (cytidine(1402)-2'-O)-methyltransferase [Candidatus Bipolaricaulota bacterium]
MTGRLYIVSLPIGNLADVTLRALEVLRTVDAIVAEDTRTTRPLLNHYEIHTPFYSSLYEGSEDSRIDDIVRRLVEGRQIALVSDAGTPLMSDPGYPLVRAALRAGIEVSPVPGACAALAALVSSGLPPDRFAFEGSLPRKRGLREALFVSLGREPRTTVAYESPHRLLETLDLLARVLPDRAVVVARELTKLHEEFLRGTAAEIRQSLSARGDVRGEIVLIIAGCSVGPEDPDEGMLASFVDIAREEGVPKRVQERLLRALGIARNRAYDAAHRER